VLVGMWLLGWFGAKAFGAGASVTPGVVYDGNGTGGTSGTGGASAAAEGGDIEMSVNPIHQDAAASAAGAGSAVEGDAEVSVENPLHPPTASAQVNGGATADAGFVEVDISAVPAESPAPV